MAKYPNPRIDKPGRLCNHTPIGAQDKVLQAAVGRGAVNTKEPGDMLTGTQESLDAIERVHNILKKFQQHCDGSLTGMADEPDAYQALIDIDRVLVECTGVDFGLTETAET